TATDSRHPAHFLTQLLAKTPFGPLLLFFPRGNVHDAERLTVAVQVFAQSPTHHCCVVLVVDLPLALLIPILRCNHVHFHPHRLHPTRRFVPETSSFVTNYDPAGLSLLLLQPAVKTHRLKPLGRLYHRMIQLPYHPVTL